MNATKHGNGNQPESPVNIRLLASDERITVQVTDQGGGQPIPEPVVPDLGAKLAGLQSCRRRERRGRGPPGGGLRRGRR